MANIYKLDNNWVSSALLPLDTIFDQSTVKMSASAVNIFVANDIALGINIGSSRFAYKHNNIRFKTAKLARNNRNITYVTRPSILRGFVEWGGEFNHKLVVQDLTGVSIVSDTDTQEISIDAGAKTMSFSDGIVFDWSSGNIVVSGQEYTGASPVNITEGDLEISFSPDAVLRRLSGNYSDIDIIEYSDKPEEYIANSFCRCLK